MLLETAAFVRFCFLRFGERGDLFCQRLRFLLACRQRLLQPVAFLGPGVSESSNLRFQRLLKLAALFRIRLMVAAKYGNLLFQRLRFFLALCQSKLELVVRLRFILVRTAKRGDLRF